MNSAQLLKFLTEEGYTHIRYVNGKLCGLQQMMFTSGIIVDLTEIGYGRRYCYENKSDALAALDSWNGEGHPTGPWIKMKGEWNGVSCDLLNPELEKF